MTDLFCNQQAFDNFVTFLTFVGLFFLFAFGLFQASKGRW